MADFQNMIERKLIPVGKSNNDVIYRCPQCEGDTDSGHLYVNYEKGYFHCFKCNLSGKRIEGLLRLLHIDVSYDYAKLYTDKDRSLDEIISLTPIKLDRIVDYSTDCLALTEYYNIHTIPLSYPAYNYLKNRGVSDESIYEFQIREGISRYGEIFDIRGNRLIGRDYSGRIMVPSMKKDDTILFYVGRDYTGSKNNKYMNPPKEIGAASEDVWNLNMIESDSIIICEGVFTAIAINQALGKMIACATYGKSIAKKSSNNSGIRVTSQGEKLLEKKFNQYIIFYDKDARQEAYDTARYLHDRGANVRVVIINTDKYGEKADAADMNREEIISHIKESKAFDRFLELF